MERTQKYTQDRAAREFAKAVHQLEKDRFFWPLADRKKRKRILHAVSSFAGLHHHAQAAFLAVMIEQLPDEARVSAVQFLNVADYRARDILMPVSKGGAS